MSSVQMCRIQLHSGAHAIKIKSVDQIKFAKNEHWMVWCGVIKNIKKRFVRANVHCYASR